jgi:hypothetical protein
MKGINDFGNGLGYLYQTALDGTTILSVKENNLEGADIFRRLAVSNAPLSVARSAVGSITITNVAAAGNLTAIAINGVDQIAGAVAITSSTPSVEAALWAAAINGFSPSSGPKFTASAQGDTIYLFSPEQGSEAVNGWGILVVVDVGSITTTTENFVNGSENTGVYDKSTGRRYWIDADYGVAGVVGSTPAQPDVITYALEITKYISKRGLENGFFTDTIVVANDAIDNFERVSAIQTLYIDTEGGAPTDTLIRINPNGYAEGDIIVVRGVSSAKVTTIVSAPVASGTSPNIYLNNDNSWATDGNNASLFLQYKYDAILGPVWLEVTKTNYTSAAILALANVGAGTGLIWRDTVSGIANIKTLIAGQGVAITNGTNDITIATSVSIGNSLFVSKSGDNATAVRGNLSRHYLTITAALAAAQSGDTVFVFPGTYTESAIGNYDNITVHLFKGAILSNSTTVVSVTSAVTFAITGDGILQTTGNVTVVNQQNASSNLYIECQQIIGGVGQCVVRTSGTTILRVKKNINIGSCQVGVAVTGGQDFYLECPEIRDYLVSDTPRTNSASYNIGIYTLSGGNIVVNAGIIDGRSGGSIVYMNNIADAANISINANIVGNNYATSPNYNTSAFFVADTGSSKSVQNININTNIVNPGTAKGLYARGATYGRLNFNGNISCTTANAIRNCSSGYYINFIGEIVTTSTSDNPVLVGLDNAGVGEFTGGFVYLKGVVKGAMPCVKTNDITSPSAPGYDGGVILDCLRLIDTSVTNCVQAVVGNPLWIYNSVMANVAADGNSTLKITGTAIIVDTDVIY